MNREFLLHARAGQVPTNAYLLGITPMSSTIDGVVHRINFPALVVDYELDNFVPVGEAHRSILRGRLPCLEPEHNILWVAQLNA